MHSILIRDVEPETLQRLKERATRNHRSLQKELHHLIAKQIAEDERLARGKELVFTMAKSTPDKVMKEWTREEIYGDDGR